MQVENCPGVLAQIAKVFGEHKVSIARVVQKNAKTDRAELVIVTEKVKEKHMGSALCELKEMKSIFEVSSMITCSSALTRRLVFSISAAISWQAFSHSARRIISGRTSASDFTAPSKSPDVKAKP